MRTLISKFVVAICVGCLGFVGSADAQSKTGKVRPPMKGDVVAVAPAMEAGTGAVNIETIRDLLRGLGHEPTIEKTGAAEVVRLVIRKDGWTYDFDISVSGNGRKIWFSSFFTQLKHNLSASELAGLLDASFKFGPAHFTYNPVNRQLNLGMCLDNRGVTGEILRMEIETFTNTIRQTVNLWDIR